MGISYQWRYTRWQNVTGGGRVCGLVYTHSCQWTTVTIRHAAGTVRSYTFDPGRRQDAQSEYIRRVTFVHRHWTQSPHRTHLRDILFWETFTKICRIEVGLKSDKNNRHFTWRPTYICGRIELNYWCGFLIKFAEKIRTHIRYQTFFPGNRAVCETITRDIAEPERPQMIKT